jgi:hypothetical protein
MVLVGLEGFTESTSIRIRLPPVELSFSLPPRTRYLLDCLPPPYLPHPAQLAPKPPALLVVVQADLLVPRGQAMNHLQAVSQGAQSLESSSALLPVYSCSCFFCSACTDAEGTGTSSGYPTTQANPLQTKCRKPTETLSAYYQLPFHETSLMVTVIPATPPHQRPNWPTLVATNSLKYLVMLNRQWSLSCLKAHRCRH